MKTANRFDYGQITSMEKTPQGFLKIPGFVTRTGVFTYRDPSGLVRRELRHPDDVLDPVSLATLKNAVVTNEHPPVMVTPENFEQYSVGYTTDRVEVNRDLIESDLIVAEKDAIADIEDNGKRELSAGYVADLEEEPGVYNGNEYDVRQRNIVYNHVAIVKRGRAGPEVRLRLDSMDAIMVDEVMVQPRAAFTPETNTDSESQGTETKEVVVHGQKVSLPVSVAEVIESMFDRYDQMRGELAKLQEEHMGAEEGKKDKKDVDISQKGISPQIPVVQKAPDGRGAPAKAGAGDKSGPAKAAGMDDDDDKKDKKKDDEEEESCDKKDFEGAGGQGVAMAPADLLKHELEEHKGAMGAMQSKHDEEKAGMQAKLDAMQAKMDEFANPGLGKGEGKMDSAEVRVAIRNRVKLERAAEKVCKPETVAKFDSMSDDEIRIAAIKAARPSADLTGKSTTYLQVRFDSITEEAEVSTNLRREMGSALLGGTSRMDAEPSDPATARRNMIAAQREQYKTPSSAVKK